MKVDYITVAQMWITESAIADSEVNLIEPERVLFVVRGMILAHSFPVAISRVPLTINQDIKALVLKKPAMAEYVLRALRGLKSEMLARVQRSSHGTCRIEGAHYSDFLADSRLAEQHRIVAKVDELMALCDRLEHARTARKATLDRLTAASLARLTARDTDAETARAHARFALDALPALTARPDQIETLRETILDLAVHGKLVEQDPADEPASKLLKPLAAEKGRLAKAGAIRREKPLPPLSETDRSVELPNGRAWVRLGNLSHFVTSGSRDWAKHYSNEGAIFVRMGNLSKVHYRLRLEQIQRVNPPPDGAGTRTRLEAGDILISITGDVGMLGLIPEGFGEAYINQHTAMVRPMPEMKDRYLAEFFRSPSVQEQFNEPQRGIKNSFRLTAVTHFVDAKLIRVRKALEETKAHGLRLKSPKSKAGRRDIGLPDIVVEALREHRRQQLEFRMALGAGKPPADALVFPGLEGGPQAPSDVSRAWGLVAEGLGMPEITLHGLRHTHASQLIEAGVDIVTISKRLGHASPDVTVRVYADMFRRDDGKAAAAINAALAGSAGS